MNGTQPTLRSTLPLAYTCRPLAIRPSRQAATDAAANAAAAPGAYAADAAAVAGGIGWLVLQVRVLQVRVRMMRQAIRQAIQVSAFRCEPVVCRRGREAPLPLLLLLLLLERCDAHRVAQHALLRLGKVKCKVR